MAFDIIVTNIKDPIPAGYFAVELMRPSIFGNPFFLSDESQRDQCIERYRNYLWDEMQKPDSPVFQSLRRLASCANDMILTCCCKPKACHGDVVREAILWLRKNPEHLFQGKKGINK